MTWTVFFFLSEDHFTSHPPVPAGAAGSSTTKPPRLALPAPADAEGHEAEPEAPGSEVPEASPTGDTPKEKVPQSPEVRVEFR